MNQIRKNIKVFLLNVLIVTILISCGNKSTDNNSTAAEDLKAKKMLQGVWVSEDDGNVVMRFDGDSIYYPDNSGEPVAYIVRNDSILLQLSKPQAYSVQLLTDASLRFTTADGDEFRLQKNDDKASLAHFLAPADAITSINQGVTIKRDSVVHNGETRYHAYVQINPTRYKVYKQGINDDGVSVEKAYYDNIIHISVYEGARSIYSHDFRKTDFAKHVPESFLQGGILSDIIIKGVKDDAVEFEAIIAEPDSYTYYRIIIKVYSDGNINMEV